MRTIVATALLSISTAAAASPEVGVAVVSTDDHTGGQLQIGWLVDRFRIAAEGATLGEATSAGGSVGFVLFDGRVERANGIERARGVGTVFLEAVAQREWWDAGFERTAFGGGVGLALRGRSSHARRVELGTQLFVRVLDGHVDPRDRDAMPLARAVTLPEHDLSVIAGLGLTFGETDGNW